MQQLETWRRCETLEVMSDVFDLDLYTTFSYIIISSPVPVAALSKA